MDFQESLPITDYKGNDHGHLSLEIVPCDDGWKNISEETYIDSPNQMVCVTFGLVLVFNLWSGLWVWQSKPPFCAIFSILSN